MVTDEEILYFFRDELSVLANWRFKQIPLQLDDTLQEYSAWDELPYAIEKFGEKFNVDVSVINFDAYCPWEIPWFFRKWFTKKPVKQTAKPLTVRMFAESAKAGRWLYD